MMYGPLAVTVPANDLSHLPPHGTCALCPGSCSPKLRERQTPRLESRAHLAGQCASPQYHHDAGVVGEREREIDREC